MTSFGSIVCVCGVCCRATHHCATLVLSNWECYSMCNIITKSENQKGTSNNYNYAHCPLGLHSSLVTPHMVQFHTWPIGTSQFTCHPTHGPIPHLAHWDFTVHLSPHTWSNFTPGPLGLHSSLVTPHMVKIPVMVVPGSVSKTYLINYIMGEISTGKEWWNGMVPGVELDHAWGDK